MEIDYKLLVSITINRFNDHFIYVSNTICLSNNDIFEAL